ncbi:IS110 family transposase [Rhodococcus opacus]|uniref:IS110 family transposase n=1 Tax=Rhodococcus opacus TaxID=37919 RepID=UPI0021C6C675|nr:transposase [Rhodococcus opacus]
MTMALTLGIDVAVWAEHQATRARDGATVWRGRKFWTRLAYLERMWADLDLPDPAELTVVVEPTRNAWIVLAEWFRRHGARVVMVTTAQSADLRKYYSKHTKNATGSTPNCSPDCPCRPSPSSLRTSPTKPSRHCS